MTRLLNSMCLAPGAYEGAFDRFTAHVEAWIRQWEKENVKPRRQ